MLSIVILNILMLNAIMRHCSDNQNANVVILSVAAPAFRVTAVKLKKDFIIIFLRKKPIHFAMIVVLQIVITGS